MRHAHFYAFAALLGALLPQADVSAAPAKVEEAPLTETSPSTGNRETSATKQKKEVKAAPQSVVKITKIHDVVVDDKGFKPVDNSSLSVRTKRDKNPALAFEKRYWSYGAVTEEEKRQKRGHYFVISWKNGGPPADLVTKLEYRQVSSKQTVRRLTLNHPAAKGVNRSAFAITGDAYETYGPIYSWRFTVSRGDTVLAEETSFIW
jgi:hypothetical protein